MDRIGLSLTAAMVMIGCSGTAAGWKTSAEPRKRTTAVKKVAQVTPPAQAATHQAQPQPGPRSAKSEAPRQEPAATPSRRPAPVAKAQDRKAAPTPELDGTRGPAAVMSAGARTPAPPVQAVAKPGARDPRLTGGEEEIEALIAEHVGMADRLLARELDRIPANPAGKPDALELGDRWRRETWGHEVAVGEVTVGEKAQGPGGQANRVLRLAYRGGDKDKVALSRAVRLALAEKGSITLDAYVLGKLPVRIALAIAVTPQRVFYESVMKSAEPQAWTRIAFDLASSDWKCQSSKWKHSAKLWGREDVREIFLLIYNGKLDGTVFIDGLKFDQAPPDRAEKPTPPKGAGALEPGQEAQTPGADAPLAEKPAEALAAPAGAGEESADHPVEGKPVASRQPDKTSDRK